MWIHTYQAKDIFAVPLADNHVIWPTTVHILHYHHPIKNNNVPTWKEVMWKNKEASNNSGRKNNEITKYYLNPRKHYLLAKTTPLLCGMWHTPPKHKNLPNTTYYHWKTMSKRRYHFTPSKMPPLRNITSNPSYMMENSMLKPRIYYMTSHRPNYSSITDKWNIFIIADKILSIPHTARGKILTLIIDKFGFN